MYLCICHNSQRNTAFMGHEVIIILTRKTRGRDWKLRDQRVGSERESFEKDSVKGLFLVLAQLKGAQVWDFRPIFFYTYKSYLGRWLEKKIIFLKDYGRYSPFCVFCACWVCAKKLPTHAEHALKIGLCTLSVRKKTVKTGQNWRTLSVRKKFA